jgi:hypothetical protein
MEQSQAIHGVQHERINGGQRYSHDQTKIRHGAAAQYNPSKKKGKIVFL